MEIDINKDWPGLLGMVICLLLGSYYLWMFVRGYGLDKYDYFFAFFNSDKLIKKPRLLQRVTLLLNGLFLLIFGIVLIMLLYGKS